jgi:ribosomal protein S18 acetylase RimI-like enzyme
MATGEGFTYERMAPQHLQQVAALHETCFPGYYLTRLGPAFLEAMYGWYVRSPEAIAYVALNQSERVVGFVAGTTRAEGYHRSLFRHQAGPLLWALLRRLVAHPLLTLGQIWERKDLLPQALSALLSPASGPSVESVPVPNTGPPAASLVSIGVEPSQRRSGIARRMTELFLREGAQRGSQLVTLSVREDNLGARRFYENLEWVEVSTSSQEYHGSLSITYQKNTSEEDESG